MPITVAPDVGGTVLIKIVGEPIAIRPSSPPGRPSGLPAETIIAIAESTAELTARAANAGSGASPPARPATGSCSVVGASPLDSLDTRTAPRDCPMVDSASARCAVSLEFDRRIAPDSPESLRVAEAET